MKASNKKYNKAGLALTHAYNDMGQYNWDLPLEMLKLGPKSATSTLKSDIKDLKKTVKINKEIIANLLSDADVAAKAIKSKDIEISDLKLTILDMNEEINRLNDKCLITDQIKAFHENNAREIEEVCEDRLQDLIEQLDQKEYVMQIKENKWNEIEKIMSIYTKTDYILREQLQQLRYLCDDTSSSRGISSVVRENETLKEQLEAAYTEIQNLMSIIQELNKESNDNVTFLDDIIEEMTESSGCIGGTNFDQACFKVPKLDLHRVLDSPDITDYKQLYQDQHSIIDDLEVANKELQKKNNKLIKYLKIVKNQSLKYKINAKDNLNRIRVVKKKLEEYEGLNVSVFEQLNNEEREMQLRELSDGKLSIFSNNNASDFGSVLIGGLPVNRQDESLSFYNKEDEIYATTGSSSQHRRAKSKPYFMKQKSEIKQMELNQLQRELDLCDLKRPQFIRVNSDVQSVMKNFKNKLTSKTPVQIPLKYQQSDLSNIRFPSERRCESPINVEEIFGDNS